jgi:hypothetical protein
MLRIAGALFERGIEGTGRNDSQLETNVKHKADLAKFIGIAKTLEQNSRIVEMTVDCFILQITVKIKNQL